MRNLFVCHSQAQLILALGLATGRFSNDNNDLILFTDFDADKHIISRLNAGFSRTLFRVGDFPAANKAWMKKIVRYPKDIKAIKAFMQQPYNKVFEVCDGNVPEIYILKRAHELNKKTEMIWLEDGSYPYYLNIEAGSGLNANNFARTFRMLFFKYVFRLGRFYDFEGNYMSSNKYLTQAYITLKGKERDIFRSKSITQISAEEYTNGISKLYATNTDVKPEVNSLLIVLDKLDVYINVNEINEYIATIVAKLKNEGRNVYYKYHPREEDALDALKDCVALNKNIAIESYYASLTHKNFNVMGIKSTSLQAAKLLGFNVISLAKIANEDNSDLLIFYSNIGIHVPVNIKSLFNVL